MSFATGPLVDGHAPSRKATLLALALVLLGGAGGCATTEAGQNSESPSSPSTTETPAVVDGTIAPLVWTVQKEGLPTSYLVGSIHVLRPTMTLPRAIDTAWSETETLVLELDVNDPETQAMVQELTQHRMLLPPSESLESMMKPKAFARLKGEMAAMGLNPTLVAHLKPWAATLLLSDVRNQKSGIDIRSGVEMRLSAKAVAEERPVIALESAAEQIDALASVDRDAAVASLELMALATDAAYLAEMNELLDAWRTGDAKKLHALTYADANVSPEAAAFIKATITDRNGTLGVRAARLLQDQKAHLIAVGAAHTVGKTSVVEVLRSEGFTVERMPREPYAQEPTAQP